MSNVSGAEPTQPSTDGLWPRSNTPPCDRPPDPWLGLSLQQQLIPTITNPGEKEKENSDPIEDMGKYIHTILDSDDEEAKQCKQEYNTALAMNTKMHIIHDNLEHLSELEKGKTEEMEKNDDPKSEERFKETWDLSVTKEEDSIVKNLCENLEKLNLEENQESDNSESSTETVIENKRNGEKLRSKIRRNIQRNLGSVSHM